MKLIWRQALLSLIRRQCSRKSRGRPRNHVVDIKGAVKNPGVYQAEADSRVIDIIDLAGGLSETADADTVNLSQRVTDKMVIYIPAVGEAAERLIAVPENNLTEQEIGNEEARDRESGHQYGRRGIAADIEWDRWKKSCAHHRVP